MTSPPESPSGLERVRTEIRGEFLRAAQSEASPKTRLWRRVLVAIALTAAIIVPVGLATGQIGGEERGFDASSAPQEALGPPVESDPGVRDVPGNRSASEAEEDTWVIAGSDPAGIKACEEPGKPTAECGLVLAIRDGAIAPGTYPQSELEAAVRAAGYEWNPSD